MIEREMEDLLWEHPKKLLGEQLSKFRRQHTSTIGRSDLIFKDRIGRFLVIEVKRGRLPRIAIPQLVDYYGMLKKEFPDETIELMVVANVIPSERRMACERYDIEAREISEKRFRDIAAEVNYVFESETKIPRESSGINRVMVAPPTKLVNDKKPWYYWQDQDNKWYILTFRNGKGGCSLRRWEAEDGKFLEKKYKSGNYQEQFAEYLKTAQPLCLSRQPNLERDCNKRLPEWILDELKSILQTIRTTKVQRGEKTEQPIRAEKGLLDDSVWRHTLQDYPCSLLCLIRQELQKNMPSIGESFNTNARYFGYNVREDKDRAYIYVQKKNLRIDLHISRKFEKDLRKEGFKVNYVNNFQGRAGWLTGWQVPHSTTDVDRVVKWLCKAFEENL